MEAVDQISVQIFEDYTASENIDVINVDSKDGPIEITLETPDNLNALIIQDLGNAETNNVTVSSTQLINGSNGFTIDQNKSCVLFAYNPNEGKYIATVLKGYRSMSSEGTLTSSEKSIFINSTVSEFTVFLNPNPEVGDEVEFIDKGKYCGTNNVLIDGNGFKILDDDQAVMNYNFIYYKLKFNGSFWNITGLLL